MAYKFYVNGKLFQAIKNSVIYKGTVTLPNGKTYDYDNSEDSVDLSAVIRAYIDQKIAETPSYTPAWNGENAKNRWNYIDGVFMNAIVNLYKYTDDESYKTFFLKYIDYYIDADGLFQQANKTSVKATGTSNNGAYSSQELDTVCESKILFDAYQFTQDSRYLTALEFTYNTLMNTDNVPIAANNLNFSHKLTYQYQVWLDGMYMYAPFWCRYAVLHKNPTVTVGNHTDTMFNILYDQFMYIKNNMKDPSTGMYFHAHDTRVPAGSGDKCFWANSSTGNSANVWGRACGWLFAALCDVLDYYPEGTKRNDLISMLSDLADAYVNHLTKNGVLRQLPTLDASVTYSGSTYTNYEEESATAQCAYGIIKGARNGYLANVTLSKGIQIFKALFNTFVLDASTNGPVTESTTSIKVGPLCISAGLSATSATSGSTDGSVKYYLYNSDPTIAKGDQSSSYAQIGYDDAKGSGPLIMAYLQYIVANDAVYNVTFTDTAQNSILTHKVKVDSGDVVMAPIILNENKPSGKTLEGWTTGSGTFNFNTPITSDITLSPVWVTAVATTYTITYSTTYGSVATKTVDNGYTLTANDLATLTQTGYTFDGWYTDSSYSSKATVGSTVTKNITLYAKWTKIPTYTVTFVSNGSTYSTATVISGGTVTKPTNPTRDGYDFGGWLDGTDVFNFNTQIYADLTLTAKWTEQSSTPTEVKVYTLDASSYTTNTLSNSMGTDGVFGFVDGVKDGAAVPMVIENNSFRFDTNYTNSLTLTADVYGPCVIRVTAKSKGTSGKVSYVGVSNGISSLDWNVDAESGSSYSTHTFVLTETGVQTINIYRANYSSTETLYISKIEIAAGTSNENYFIENTPHYTITYSTTYGSVATKTVETGYTLTSSDLPTLTQDGYTFGGWYINSGYTTSATTSTTVTSDIILYAKWTEQGSVPAFSESLVLTQSTYTAGTRYKSSPNEYIEYRSGSSDSWYTANGGGARTSGNTSGSRYIKVVLPVTCNIVFETGTTQNSGLYVALGSSAGTAPTSGDTVQNISKTDNGTTITWSNIPAGTYYINASNKYLLIRSITITAV